MYTLIALLTMTTLGSYPTQARCEAAVRQIYAQQMDPYNMMEPAAKKKMLALKMKYVAPREYRCQKV
jgi:hypothetical protein